MSDRPTLLARLSWKFSHQPETVATEALGHILCESAAARDALVAFLRSHEADVGSIVNAKTELMGAEGERPDLVCLDGDDRERVLIELKFWAGLTGNQPVTYLERLPDCSPSALLVVAPARRIEPLWSELRSRVRDGMEVKFREGRAGSDVRRAKVGDRRALVLASWRGLLNALKSGAADNGDYETVSDIRQLSGLAVQQEDHLFPLRSEQLGPDVPRLIVRLPRLLEDVYGRLVDKELVPKKWPQVRVKNGVYRYIILGGCVVWFGARYRLWAKHGQTPLWLGFGKRATEDRIDRKLEQRWDGKPPESLVSDRVVPVLVRPGYSYYEVLDDVVAQLQYLAGLFEEIYAADTPDEGSE